MKRLLIAATLAALPSCLTLEDTTPGTCAFAHQHQAAADTNWTDLYLQQYLADAAGKID